MPDYTMRRVEPDELDRYLRAVSEAFHADPGEDELEFRRMFTERERTLAVFAGDEIVATSGLLTFDLTVPGAIVEAAGVSAVGVHAVHRGRGLLDRMMLGQLEAIHERGAEAIACLWASEAGLYGRYGYGLATRNGRLEVRSREARLLHAAPARPRHAAPAELVDDMTATYEAIRPHRPGLLSRDERAWKERISDLASDRDGAGRLRGLVSDGADGPEGYALFAVRKHHPDGRPSDVVVVRELFAATGAATATLWEFLLGLSLSRTVRWDLAPEDEPLVHLLGDPRAVNLRVSDGLFVRLVDVGRALAQRTYAAPIDVVLDVRDERCGWNAGRWRLAGDPGGATCEPTSDAADLALGTTELGAAYLGGTTLAVLAAAGRVEQRTPGALEAAGRAFRGVRAPWCPETF